MHSNFTMPNGWGFSDPEPSDTKPPPNSTDLGAIIRLAEEMGQKERSLALVLLQAIAAWNGLADEKRAA